MTTAQRILKNIASLLFSGIIAQVIAFAAVVYLARILGPGDFGEINFAIAIVSYFTLIADLGLPLLGTREVARDRSNIDYYLGNILTIRLCLAVLGFAFVLLFVTVLNRSLETKLLIILYGIGLFPFSLLLDWVFQGIERMEYIGLGRVAGSVIYTVLVLLFINNSTRLLLIPCFQVASSFFVTGLLIVIYVKACNIPRLNLDFTPWKKFLQQAMPLGISIILIQIIYNIDTIMLGFMKGNMEVGYYNAAYKIILPLIMIGAAYFDAIFPVMSNYYATSLDSLRKLQSYTVKLMVTISLPMAAGGTILAKPIMDLVYGPTYNDGILTFQILIWVPALICLNMIYARGMWACNKQNAYLKIVTGQGVTNIGLNFTLIPSLGIQGAAISTVAAECLGFLFYYRGFNKVVYAPIHNVILKPLIAAIAMAMFLRLGKDLAVFILIPGGMLIYTIALYFMKGITVADVRLIKCIFGSRKA